MFDTARHLLVVGIHDGVVVGREEQFVRAMQRSARSTYLVDLGIDTLICGAISKPLEVMLTAAGVSVIAFRCGSTEDILQAFLRDQLDAPRLLMPGVVQLRHEFQDGDNSARDLSWEHDGNA